MAEKKVRIAIVGLACRYPDATNPLALWESVLAQRQAFRPIPPERVPLDEYGGTRLDAATLAHVTAVVKTLGRIVQDGHAKKRFRKINPMLIHAGIIGPLLLYFASGPMRRRLASAGVPGVAALSRDLVVAHVQRVAVMALEGNGA